MRIYDCCEHWLHPPAHIASEADWQLWHTRPCDAIACATGRNLIGQETGK